MRSVLLPVALAACACGAPPPDVEEPLPEPAPPTLESGPEEPGPEQFIVTIGKLHITKDGLTFMVTRSEHEHTSGGGEVAFYQVEFTDGDDVHEIEYDHYGGLHWYVEGVAHGYIYTVEVLSPFGEPQAAEDADRRKVTLIPYTGPALEYEKARDTGAAMGVALAEEIGCEGDTTGGALYAPGAYDHTILMVYGDDMDVECRIHVGIYTGTAFITYKGKTWVEKAD
jgi:hypothetical protein